MSLCVVGSGVVTKDQLDHAMDSLETVNGKLLGLVLNRVPRERSGGYCDYRYEDKPEPAKGSKKARSGDKSRGEGSGRRRRLDEKVTPDSRHADHEVEQPAGHGR